jgi:excisionase family DNA binding protein
MADTPSRWMTIDEAGAYMKLGRKTIYNAVKRGTLRAAVVDGRRSLRFCAAWCDQFLEASAPRIVELRRDRGAA